MKRVNQGLCMLLQMAGHTNTKIVATLGPATDDPLRLGEVLAAGVNICRLNFSHGSASDHAERLASVRTWAQEYRWPLAVLGDLCGPKIRLNQVSGDSLSLPRGHAIRFVRGNADCTAEELTTNYAPLVDEIEVGQRIYVDDGLVRFLVIERGDDHLECSCTTGGVISNRKGVNLPDSSLSTPALTEKDRGDLVWAIEHGLDFVALSFVRNPADVAELRELIDQANSNIRVIAKIEMPEALKHLDEIIALSDAVMVARGDLGVEMDVWRVPAIQKSLIDKCRWAGKPVIVATQMLQSMTENVTPTRAEVSDVANAINEGTDAVMLSAESAVGTYPIESVEMMKLIARTTESQLATGFSPRWDLPKIGSKPEMSAVVRAAVEAAQSLSPKAVAAWTQTGETVQLLARHRLPMPIIGLAPDEWQCRQLNLLYGVIPIQVEAISHPDKMAKALDSHLIQRKLAEPGDLIIVVTSTHPETPGTTDTVLVHRVSG
jgi:pyruvate kinase